MVNLKWYEKKSGYMKLIISSTMYIIYEFMVLLMIGYQVTYSKIDT